MTENRHKIFNIILILLPIIDVLTSITTRFTNVSLTVGTIIKGLMLLYFAIYILFLTNSKIKKLARIFLLSNFIFVILYFLFKSDLLSKQFLLTELVYLFKILFFPILFAGLLCYYGDSGFKKDTINKILLINIILYILLLGLPLVTNTAFNTYLNGNKGYVGWYYSGNEISAIVVLLFPFLYTLIKEKKILFLILALIGIVVISMIGTKVAMFGMYIVGILIVLTILFMREKKDLKKLIIPFVTFIMIVGIMSNSYALHNMNNMIDNEDNIIIEEIIDLENAEPFLNKNLVVLLKLLSGRNIYILNTNKIFLEHFNVSTLFFGLGFSNTEMIDDAKITKLIEIDLLDTFYHTGIFGIAIVLLPFLFVLYLVVENLLKKRVKFNANIFFYGMMILFAGGISCVSGHVLLDPAVSIYIALYMILLLNELNLFSKKEIIKNNVQILSLHLGYGGAERASVDLANILSEKYDVELVSLYKTQDVCPFCINDKVKVNYLTDTKPNRDEFKNALKSFNIVSIFREGIKAIKILYLKHYLIRTLVQESDAEYIVSSRIYFTSILNKYGRTESKKIAIEHNYNLNEKFVEKLKRCSSNIDALVCVSKRCKEIYEEILHNVKVLYIPNIVSDEYDVTSKLNTKNLIYVGRLEEEKGTRDLVELMRLIKDKDSDVHLDIIGDGTLKDEMSSKIKEYDLNNNVMMHGFKDANYISKYYKNASLFVLVSHTESFGIVLIEAMKCGIPAIAFSEATGATYIIEDKKNGFLIKNRDLNRMAEKILAYMKYDSSKKEKMQKRALATASKYTSDNVKKMWFKLFDSLKN